MLPFPTQMPMTGHTNIPLRVREHIPFKVAGERKQSAGEEGVPASRLSRGSDCYPGQDRPRPSGE